MNHTIKLSKEFKAGLRKSIASIVFFIVVYVCITVLFIALTALLVYAAGMLIVAYLHWITLIIGTGLASLGILVLIFLLKFIFQTRKVDRSHLQEITQTDEPELFNFVYEIAAQVGTHFPKKIYWSPDVNAAVFYDSSFWSMFFPVKKNLLIGMGLVNTVSKEELKAILAHEFGHFSQRTMKVGSYVYNVNNVIFNMLFDNESYNKLVEKWSSINGYLSIFVLIAVKINQAIQWLLKIMYQLININYMALSREMEFHADEIAANVTGYQPLKNALLRMNLAQYAYNSVLNYYEGQVKNNIRSENIYAEQQFVMNFLAQESSIPFIDNLPQVTLKEYNKFNKSKLYIKDQWASHPSDEERIKRLESLNIVKELNDNCIANVVLCNVEKSQKQLTDKLFSMVSYSGKIINNHLEAFKSSFEKQYPKIDKNYNGYYDFKNPVYFEIPVISDNNDIHFSDLFSQTKRDLIYTSIALQEDIQILTQIDNKVYKVKTFDYDGKKYKQSKSRELLEKLTSELENINEQIKNNDILIYRFFKELETNHHKKYKLENLYKEFFTYDKEHDEKYLVYVKMLTETQFMSETTPFDIIKQNLKKVKEAEKQFKVFLGGMINDERFLEELSQETREKLNKYLTSDFRYFNVQTYRDNEIELLFMAMNEYYRLLSMGYYLMKKGLLDYQVELLNSSGMQKMVSF